MNEPKYICLSDEETFCYEDELRICSNCGGKSCPTCGGDIQTIEQYNENMRINSEEE